MLFCSGHRIFGRSLRRDVDCTASYCRMGFNSSDLGVKSPRFGSWLFVPLANEVTLIKWIPRTSFTVTILHWLSHLLPFPTGPLWELNKTVDDRCFPNCGELGQWYCFAPESWASCKYPCLPIQGRCWAGDSEKGDLPLVPHNPVVLRRIRSALGWVSLPVWMQQAVPAWLWGGSIISFNESLGWSQNHTFLDKLTEWSL